MKYWLGLVVALAAACGSGSSTQVSRRECEALRDHLVELRMQSSTVDREQHRAALQASLADEFVNRCLGEVSREQLRCTLAATDSQAVTACHVP
jgi:small lipoprotein (TIGR04454 family)